MPFRRSLSSVPIGPKKPRAVASQHSKAEDRRSYLLRPDLGRRLRERDRAIIPFVPGAMLFVVCDGLSATGMPDGKYLLGGFEVIVTNGVCRNAAGILAGSTLTLDRALRNIVNLGVPLADAVRMLTLNPASLLGIEFKKGSLRTGADADVLLLDQDLCVTDIWTRGRPVH